MNLNRFSPRTLVVTGVLLGLVCTFSGCLTKHIVGNPAKSKIDKNLVGYWHFEQENRGQFFAVAAFDERAYVVDYIVYRGELSDPTVTHRTTYKAWLTKIEGQTLVTMQPLQPQRLFGSSYVVGKLDGEGDKMTFSAIRSKFAAFEQCTSSKELEKAIADNIDNAGAFARPREFTRQPLKKGTMKAFFGG